MARIKLSRSPLFAEIHAAAIPEWAPAHRAADALKAAAQHPYIDPNVQRASVSESLIQAAAAPKADFAAVLAGHRAAKAAELHREQDRDALRSAAITAETNLAVIEETHIPSVIAEIRDRVETLQTSLDGLKSWPATAQDAINRKAVEDFQAIQSAEATFYALAKVYNDAVGPTLESGDHPRIIPAAFIANPLDQHPYFLHRRAGASVAGLTVARHGLHKAAEEWTRTAPAIPFGPHTSGGSPVPQGASASAWFRYIISNGYIDVHDPARALELWSAASEATDPFNERNVRAHLEARKDYYELLGDEEQLTTMLDLIPKRRGSVFA